MQHSLWRLGMIVIGAVWLLGTAEFALRARYQLRAWRARDSSPAAVTIVALGDSITAGWPGEPDAAWPALLSRMLAERYPGVTWRVVNAGIPGDTAPLGYARFDRDVTVAGPRLVLIAFGLNDCNPARYGMDRWLEEAVPNGIARSYLWRAVQRRAAQWGRSLGIAPVPQPEVGRQPLPRTSAAGFARTLDALVARTRDIGARPALLTMTPLSDVPGGEMLALRDAHAAYNAIIRRAAADTRAFLVDVATGEPDNAVDVDGVHMTALGHAWIADQVFCQLARAGVWAELVEEAGR